QTTAACPLYVGRSSSGSGSGSSGISKTASARGITQPEPEPQPPPPLPLRRLRFRRPIHTSGSLLALAALIMCQLHSDSGGGGGVAAAPLLDDSSAFSSEQMLLPRSMQKRHHHPGTSFRLRFQRELNASTESLDWENTCGGNWTGSETKIVTTPMRCRRKQKVLKDLQNQTIKEVRSLRDDDKSRETTSSERELANKTNKAIDITDMGKWNLHNSHYTFLPRLNANSSKLIMRHVHRDLQFYVGAFSYLRHAKLHWDFANLQAESVMSADLERMRASARRALCNVEVAINATNRLYPALAGSQLRRPMTRQLMEKRLQQFKTPLVELHEQATLAARGLKVTPPAFIPDQLATDARFVKREFVRYLRSIRHILQRQRKVELEQKKCTHRSPKAKARPA
ncbi:hypothetical protein KR018_002118, partial [Drosophila ironensis]